MNVWQIITKKSLRELIFGLEDGLVSTLGVITGIAIGTEKQFVIILSGFIVVIVESVSMASGTFLANQAEIEQDHLKKRNHQHSHATPVISAIVMSIAYLIGGSVPVLPYFFIPIAIAMKVSVVLTMLALFFVGFFKGQVTKISPLRSGLEMVVVSATAALVGFLIGKFGSDYFGLN